MIFIYCCLFIIMTNILRIAIKYNVTRNTKFAIKAVETIYFTSWKDGYFIFNEATLGEIMKELSKWYDFDYGFADTGTTEIRLTARLKKYDDINLILDILSRTGAIGFSQRERFITIENKKQ